MLILQLTEYNKMSEINIETLIYRMKKVLPILLVVLFILSLTAVTASAQGYYTDGNYHTYYNSNQPGYIITNDVPVATFHLIQK